MILAATAFAAHRVLRGPVLADVLEPVSPDLLRSAVLGGARGV
ncbi:hypothetical protein [Amycolatopsis azurea]|uniref:Uncharacterized protein n=1 Tax=Amycolatopsis azurea DSM 43854 TaxID=1238180 RepID=M2NQX3_9PSEU|nr:hypothetical protein [Amycolatopsis azurea]EMD24714.1 hypothetical protein C791_5734 [Amycolatopsis azurea DSM 43854]